MLRAPLPGPQELRAAVQPQAEQETRRDLAAAQEVHERAVEGELPAARAALADARRRLHALSPRSVLPHEHGGLLDVAVGLSRHRLLIVTRGVTGQHVGRQFTARLRATLDHGAAARIVIDTSAGHDETALAALRAVARDYPALEIELRDAEHDCVLLSDSRFLVLGAYPWLGQLGNADRPVGCQHSLLSTEPNRIEAEWHRFDARPPVPGDRRAGTAPGRADHGRARSRGRRRS
jgi:hypothetical protein